MKIVNAEISDAPMIGETVVMAVGDEITERFAHPRPKEDVLKLFIHLAARNDSQYSYLNTLKALSDDGKPMGFIIGYDGEKLPLLRKAFFEEVRTALGREMEGTIPDECSPDEFYLDSLAVFPEYRGAGVARSLISVMSERAAGYGKPLGLLCDKENTRARRLYESLGFIKVGETPFADEMMNHMQIPLKSFK